MKEIQRRREPEIPISAVGGYKQAWFKLFVHDRLVRRPGKGKRACGNKIGGKPVLWSRLPSGLLNTNEGSRGSHGKKRILSDRLAATSGNESKLGARQFILDNLE